MFGTSTEKKVAREVDRIVSMKEDVDALSWGRVLEIGKLLREPVDGGTVAEYARELVTIAQSNLSLAARLGMDAAMPTGPVLPSGMEVVEGGYAEAALQETSSAAAPSDAGKRPQRIELPVIELPSIVAATESAAPEEPSPPIAGSVFDAEHPAGAVSAPAAGPLAESAPASAPAVSNVEPAAEPATPPAVPAAPVTPPAASAAPATQPAVPDSASAAAPVESDAAPVAESEAPVIGTVAAPVEPVVEPVIEPEGAFCSGADAAPAAEIPVPGPAETNRAVSSPTEAFAPIRIENPEEFARNAEEAGAAEQVDAASPSVDGGNTRSSRTLSSERFARFRSLYESQDGSLCVFEDEHGHLVAVDASRLA